MQRWEYCQLNGFSTPYSVTFFRPDRAVRVEARRDKSKGDQNDTDAYNRTLAELGQQGWEAVGFLGQTGTILFKRPIS